MCDFLLWYIYKITNIDLYNQKFLYTLNFLKDKYLRLNFDTSLNFHSIKEINVLSKDNIMLDQ